MTYRLSIESRILNKIETIDLTIQKELLAVAHFIKYFRLYLYGTQFLLITDHKLLKYLFKLKDPNSLLIRLKLKLSEYEFDILHKKNLSYTNVDALSRTHTK